MILYVSGPMSGYPEWNMPAFNQASEKLRRQGHRVFNPAETAGGDGDLPRDRLISVDIAYIQNSDALVMLPAWKLSLGANLELAVAYQLGKRIFEYDPGDPGLLGPEIFFRGLDTQVTFDPSDPARVRFTKEGHIERPRTPWGE